MRNLVALALLGGVLGCQAPGLVQSVPQGADSIKLVLMPDGTVATLQPMPNGGDPALPPVNTPNQAPAAEPTSGSAAAHPGQPTPAPANEGVANSPSRPSANAGPSGSAARAPTTPPDEAAVQQAMAEVQTMEAQRRQAEAMQESQRMLTAAMENLTVKLKELKDQVRDLQSRMDNQDALAEEE